MNEKNIFLSPEHALEAELVSRGLTYPRVTPDQIDSLIDHVQYHHLEGTMTTTCYIRLKNKFIVTGTNSCASPGNFQKDLGERMSFMDARNKIWELEGYVLKNKLFGPTALNIQNGISQEDIRRGTAARMAHAVNRAYCKAIGDAFPPEWEDCTQEHRNSMLMGVDFRVANPGAGPEASHESWRAQKVKDGWVYGPVKNESTKEHPCIVLFETLPVSQQIKDILFTDVVKTVYKEI